MNRRKNLLALDSHSADEGTPVTASDMHGDTEYSDAGNADWHEGAEPSVPSSRFGWVFPLLAAGAVIGWTGFFIWANRATILVPASPQQWVGWIGSWSLPVVLVIGLWLLAMRNSTREAARFASAAKLLAAESAQLEARLAAVNRELSLARDFIASQSRDLEALGRVASDRLSQNAAALQDLIRENGEQVAAIGQVSDNALANMNRLRDQLPVISNSARDVANQIGHAGNTAQSQLDEMVAAFQRLNDFGEASGRQVEALRVRLSDILSRFEEHLAELGRKGERLTGTLLEGQEEARSRWEQAVAQLQQDTTSAIEQLAALDQSAIGNARERMEALTQAGQRVDRAIVDSMAAFDAEIARRREEAAQAEADALATLQARLERFDAEARRRDEAHIAHLADVARRSEELAGRLNAFDAELSRLFGKGRTESAQLGEAAETLVERLSQSRAIMEESRSFVSRLTDDSVRLLEIIRASSEHSENDLSDSIAKAESRLSAFETRSLALRDTIAEAEARGAALAGHVAEARQGAGTSLETLGILENNLARIAGQTRDLADSAQGELRNAIAALEEAVTQSLSNLQERESEAVRNLARQIGKDAGATLEETLREAGRNALSEMDEASRNAAEQGRAVAVQLRDQLAKVNQLAANLESRVAQARAQAEEQVDTDFTRRMALITESLNSASIDIARVFDAEVADTAWASYLRGDRGIFTRRAVRLLDNGEARAVMGIYEQDPQIRETVNRYIHDFEAMLRTVLSTRDGNALAVTILSSDIGKLYVALAQAIERLRD
ncbi:ATPase [Altererythrobacter lauratis]|uniref:ATPase n=1 Tax=Alteraurantiacibacter lauratis TaxID=2054627 RepID=A0ABV7ED85_9SPHN